MSPATTRTVPSARMEGGPATRGPVREASYGGARGTGGGRHAALTVDIESGGVFSGAECVVRATRVAAAVGRRHGCDVERRNHVSAGRCFLAHRVPAASTHGHTSDARSARLARELSSVPTYAARGSGPAARRPAAKRCAAGARRPPHTAATRCRRHAAPAR